MNKIFLFIALLVAQSLRAQTYAGLMDNFFPLEMTLTIEADQATGTYHYARVGKTLSLRGTAKLNPDKSLALALEEFNEKNEMTGKFEGTLTEKKFSGKWSKPDGSKSQPVELENVNDLCAKAGLSAAQREELFAKIKKHHIVVPTVIPKGLSLTQVKAESESSEYALTYSDGKPNGKSLTFAMATGDLGGRVPSGESGAVEKSLPIKTALFGETRLEYSEIKGKAADLFWGWYELQRLLKGFAFCAYSVSAENLSPSEVQAVIESLALVRSPKQSAPAMSKPYFSKSSSGKPDEAFIAFFEKFREAVAKKDKNAVAAMMRYPFSSDVKNKKDLMKWYDDVFNEAIVEAITTMTEIVAEKDGTMTMFQSDLMFSFVKVGNEYKFANISAGN